MGERPAVGTKWRYTGASGKYFTQGVVYEVLPLGVGGLRVVGDIAITDNFGTASNGGAGHSWDYRTFHRHFEAV